MFGLEKEEKKAKKFDFDLEVEIKENTNRGKEIIDQATQRTEELKSLLRSDKKPEHLDDYGILLHGYAALSRVIKKVNKEIEKK